MLGVWEETKPYQTRPTSARAVQHLNNLALRPLSSSVLFLTRELRTHPNTAPRLGNGSGEGREEMHRNPPKPTAKPLRALGVNITACWSKKASPRTRRTQGAISVLQNRNLGDFQMQLGLADLSQLAKLARWCHSERGIVAICKLDPLCSRNAKR